MSKEAQKEQAEGDCNELGICSCFWQLLCGDIILLCEISSLLKSEITRKDDTVASLEEELADLKKTMMHITAR